MTKPPETDRSGNFSKNIAQEMQNVISKLSQQGKKLIQRVCSLMCDINPMVLLGAAKIGQLLLFLKERLKPKQYEEAVADTLGWVSLSANQLLKLAPILGKFSAEQLNVISENLSLQALYQLAAGRTPLEVIESTLQKACEQKVDKKDIQQQTKKYKEAQPKKKPTPWRYVGNGREYQPPRISEQAGLVVEQLCEKNGTPRRFVLEEAVLLLSEKFQQEVFAVAEIPPQVSPDVLADMLRTSVSVKT